MDPRLLLLPQMSRRRLKILRAAGLHRLGRFLLLSSQILDIRLAQPAANRLDMKLNVIGLLRAQRAEQMTAELIASRARQPLPPPNLADAMHPRIAPRVNRRQLLEQLWLLAQLRLD